MWANKLMQQWDLFISSNPSDLSGPSDYFLNRERKYFKRADDESYTTYRQVMQILDGAILDIQTVQYKPKILVCSILYLILGTACPIKARNWASSARSASSTSFPAPPSSSSTRQPSTHSSDSSSSSSRVSRCLSCCPVSSTCRPSLCCL